MPRACPGRASEGVCGPVHQKELGRCSAAPTWSKEARPPTPPKKRRDLLTGPTWYPAVSVGGHGRGVANLRGWAEAGD